MCADLWIDKYVAELPKTDQEKLQTLAGLDDMPHILFYGPPGCGKRSRANLLLKQMYGRGVDHLIERSITIHSGYDKDSTDVYYYQRSDFHFVIEGSSYTYQSAVLAIEHIFKLATAKSLSHNPKPFVVLLIT